PPVPSLPLFPYTALFRSELAALLEMLLGATLQLAQDECGNLRRRELAIRDADADYASRIAGHAERQQRGLAVNILDTAPHEPLDRVHRARRRGQQAPLRLAADEDRAVFADGHDGRDERIAAVVADDNRSAVLDIGDETVGRPEI